ncbi:MAG: alpha/beta hydrolase fold domain-containing protein [Kiritimatiellae bacterium]|nr:alpha/beta hydrolase fold domain-containing protein [Kiritimatiellia bacterium]
MKKQLVLSFAIGLRLAAFGLAFNVEKGIRYSDAASRCVLDVKWPAGATNFATVVNFHGGGLVGGNRHFARWPEEAADKDPVAFVAAGYRLLQDKKTGDAATPEECISDAAAAVAWTLDNISRYGGDPKKVFVTGISGGGYLTAMIGLDPKWLARYGHAPSDLAGIAPMTGQMAKHFNVRKIGFRDPDPQYQPKIDEWAPLAYAGGTNLPPACFLTGGRDAEWKCRVEENELLAASLRSCGYPKTEFHETEGNHGGGVRPSAYFLRDFVVKTCDTGAVGRFADGERVLFCGDSITHGGKFIYYLQMFQDLRHPGSNVRLVNGGRSGDTAGGGLRRFDRDIMSFKADRAFVMFGMNDISRNSWKNAEPSGKEAAARARAVEDYRANMAKLAEKFIGAGIKTVLMTPSPFDQYGVFEKANIPFCNDPGLASCAAIVRELAAARNLGLVDLHAPLTQLFKEHAADYRFCKDRVHPGDEGHLIMAARILDAMHVSPLVARVQIDAANGTVAKAGHGQTMNAAVTAIRASAGGLAFTYAPKALPFPKLPEYVKASEFYPLTERLNQEVIAVTGLARGSYDLAFDGAKAGAFSAEELAAGVNVALLDTPNQKRAQAIADPMRRLQANQTRVRQVILVQLMLQDNRVDISDRAAADAWLANWLEKQKKSEWYNGVKAWVDGYQAGRDALPAMQAEAEDLYEQMGAARPAVSRVTIAPAR